MTRLRADPIAGTSGDRVCRCKSRSLCHCSSARPLSLTRSLFLLVSPRFWRACDSPEAPQCWSVPRRRRGREACGHTALGEKPVGASLEPLLRHICTRGCKRYSTRLQAHHVSCIQVCALFQEELDAFLCDVPTVC